MTDRRRINGPPEGTTPPVFLSGSRPHPSRRSPRDLRKLFLKTSLTPPATGSAFLEIPSPPPPHTPSSTLKLTASVYGPRPLPSSSIFSPHARVTAEVKFAPFSTPHKRRGYVRDAVERDLSAQLQNALAKAVRTAQYPKSGIDVFVTVLDCEGGLEGGSGDDGVEVGLMGVLAGAVTCASAAVADAGIECFDLVSGGVAALVGDGLGGLTLVLDPSPFDGYKIYAAAAVGFMAARDELSLLWTKGSIGADSSRSTEGDVDALIDGAISAATAVRLVLNDAVKERLLLGMGNSKVKDVDTVMA